jgi:hypothetical protein
MRRKKSLGNYYSVLQEQEMNHERDVRFRGNHEQDQNGNGNTQTGNHNVFMEDPQQKKATRKRFISESAYQKYGSKSGRCKFTEFIVCEEVNLSSATCLQTTGFETGFLAQNLDRIICLSRKPV